MKRRIDPVHLFFVILVSTVLLAPAGLLAGDRGKKNKRTEAAEALEMPPVRGAVENIGPEPVFNGNAYIFQSGMGNPASVVLVHGIGDDTASRVWKNLIPELSLKYHVVAFDLPGFGRSTKANVLYSPALYTDFIKWVVDTYVKGPYILIGHSLGGALSLRYAAFYPENIQKLVLVNAAGILHRIAFTRYAVQVKPARSSSWLKRVGSDVLNSLTLNILEDIEGNRTDEDLNKILNSPSMRKALLGANPSKIAGTALMQEDFSGIVERIKTPTLIVWSTNDIAAPLRTGKVLKALIPGSRLEIIPRCGHVPMLQRPEQFNKLILEEVALSQGQIQPEKNDPSGYCSDQKGMVFTGKYKKIEIINCSDVQVIDADAGPVEISGSEVSIENSRIAGKEIGLKAINSEVVMTSGRIEAETAVYLSGSSLDLAGVELIGKKAAAVTDDKAEILFSLSKAESPFTSGRLHGRYQLVPDRPM